MAWDGSQELRPAPTTRTQTGTDIRDCSQLDCAVDKTEDRQAANQVGLASDS